MGLIISTGYRERDICALTSRLQMFDVADPEPCGNSGLTASDILDRMPVIAASKDARSSYQQHPGRAWEYAVSDLVLSNSSHETWGWGDSRLLRYLEFIKSVEPEADILIAYASPAKAIADLLLTDLVRNTQIDEAMEDWVTFHSEVLRFYHAYHNSTVLCHESHIAEYSDQFSELCILRFGLNKTHARETEQEGGIEASVFDYISDEYLEDFPAAKTIYEELQVSADLPGLIEGTKKDTRRDVLIALDRLRTSVNKTERELDFERKKVRDLEAAVHSLETELAQKEQDKNGVEEQANITLLQLHEAHDALSKLQVAHQREVADRDYTINALKDRFEAQSIRLETVQGELAHVKSIVRGGSVRVDFCEEISGSNWYGAEPDGRWAGPELRSTLAIPEGLEGQYQVEILVSSGMSLEVLNGLRLYYGSTPLSVEKKILSNLGGRKAEFTRAIAAIRNIPHPYPVRLKALFSLQRNSESQLVFEFPKMISPSSDGVGDSRQLGIKVRWVSFTRID